jgi:hypothetical protein
MSGGMLDHLTEAVAVQEFVGCDFGTAMAMVRAANDCDLEAAAPADNVIRVDFSARCRVDHG